MRARVALLAAAVTALAGCGTVVAARTQAHQARAAAWHAARHPRSDRRREHRRRHAHRRRHRPHDVPPPAAGDWPQFDYDAQRSGVGPASTGITAANLGALKLRTVALPGIADSSAIVLAGVAVAGHARDVIALTTSYGRTLAIDAETGQKLWEFTPSDIGSYQGSPQFTTATPTADPDRQYVYAATPDGLIHKLAAATGAQVTTGGWPARVTLLPSKEKLATPPSIDGSALIVTTDGYIGDAPPYQGHVVRIDRATGKVEAVWNSLCSNVHHLLSPASGCPVSDSAIWGRGGAVIERSGNILVATGNGAPSSTASFNGTTNWSDSVLELSPGLRLLHNWTPTDQLHLTRDDLDLGSTAPALLPGGYAVQGGKAGVFSLLDLARLDGTTGPAGPRTGGEVQTIAEPGSSELLTQPAVWTSGGRTYVFAADDSGTAAYLFSAAHRLSVAWQDSAPGTSPVIGGGLLYVYDESDGAIVVRSPTTGRRLASLPVGGGHWNSPIVVGGRIILPTGDANSHGTSGALAIYHLPGD
jgi:outer membrane protein assembly factor BamB